MAGLQGILGVLKAVALLSWRNVRSLQSIAGQNFFLVVVLVALGQPESAEFFAVVLVIVLLFPLSADPLEAVPTERRLGWPLRLREWIAIRVGAFALTPAAWLALFILSRASWQEGGLVVAFSELLQLITSVTKRFASGLSTAWMHWIPAPPGAIGSIMLLQWRGMLRTLDPYVALALMACTELYKLSGKSLHPAAHQILSLLVVLALSTEMQVLMGIDGHGAERYRYLPIRGWQILLAKDLALLVLLGLLILPLDLVSGLCGGLAGLAIGHHQSVLKPARQVRWRFTSGALFPDGALQIVAIVAVGLQIRSVGWPLALVCSLAWLASLLIYGWQWDRQK